jgi:DNA-binding transcriptional LysR family regulator
MSHAWVMHELLRRVPRLQMLAVFECAARLGSFTSAAGELGMTQSGVSRQISALERSISRKLFDRKGNKVQLNRDGQILLTATESGFDTMIRGLASLEDPTFVFAANPGYAQRFLIPHRESLQAQLGDVALRLRLFDRDGELHGDAFDVAIHLTSQGGLPPGSKLLFEEVVVPVASADFAAQHSLSAASSPARLLEMELLHLDGRDRQWMGWPDWFGANEIRWSSDEAVMSYNNYALVMDDAFAGRGIALAWRGLVDNAVDAGLLVEVGVPISRADRGYYLIPGLGVDPELIARVADWLTGLATS